MPRKKREPERSVSEQTVDYLRQLLTDFENITGMRVVRVEVAHKRPIGFGREQQMDITIITE